MEIKVINGDNLEILKNYPDNYFDAVVTDPPYGLGKEPDTAKMLSAWLEHGYMEVKGSGFMGKEWDAFVPQPIFWKEVFRVLKHGGHVLAFYGTRTYDWGVMAMRLAGFEVRDCIQWVYGSGFPKSHNISKAIDKMYGAEREVVGKSKAGSKERKGHKGDMAIMPFQSETVELNLTAPATDQAKEWEGWGSALKPANEPIVLARKPLEKGLSIAENVLKWGTGAINIDGCRVGFTDNVNMDSKKKDFNTMGYGGANDTSEANMYNSQGRFPANLILGCSCADEENHNEDCPIRIMDEQSGELKSGKMTPNHKRTTDGSKNGIYGKFDVNHPLAETYGDKGGASRFFYVAKASKSERNKGLEGFEEKRASAYGYEIGLGENGEGMFKDRNPIKQNFHPTVKPIKLMQYLVRLVTPPNGIVLDPFCGSGTTGVACKLEGFQFVGLEQDLEYSKIAEARIRNYVEGKEPPNPVTEVDKPTFKTKLEQLNLFNEQQHD